MLANLRISKKVQTAGRSENKLILAVHSKLCTGSAAGGLSARHARNITATNSANVITGAKATRRNWWISGNDSSAALKDVAMKIQTSAAISATNQGSWSFDIRSGRRPENISATTR